MAQEKLEFIGNVDQRLMKGETEIGLPVLA